MTAFLAAPRGRAALSCACLLASLIGTAHAQPQPSKPASHTAPAPTPVGKTLYQTLLLSSGHKVSYRVLVPDGYLDTVPAPLLIALPPGDQGRPMVDVGISRYWSAGPALGWVVVSPAALAEVGFVDLAPGLFKEFVDAITTLYPPEGGQVHLAGVSNGGRSAVRFATLMPNHFASVLAVPGFAPTAEDFERLSDINCPVRLVVGEQDTKWVKESRATLERLLALGKDAAIEVRPGEGHMVAAAGADLFRTLDALRTESKPATAQTPAPAHEHAAPAAAHSTADIITVLDDFHDAAAKADGPRYFGLFATDGVFLGTDDTERWTVDEFRAYAEPYFSKGKGWVYVPSDRHIDFSETGTVAWFNEKLDNEKYGRCRGTGVLVRKGSAWRIAQYNLTVPIPNDMLAGVAAQIREKAAPPQP